MDTTPATSLPPLVAGPRLLHRLTAPLRRAGWSEVEMWSEDDEYDEYDDEYDTEDDRAQAPSASLEFTRSNFHLGVRWDPAAHRLVLDDPTEGGLDWDDSLPPLCPLDAPLVIELGGHGTQAAKAEAARRAFAAAGLLDATRLHLPEGAEALRTDLVMLLLADHVNSAIDRHRNDGDDTDAIASLGKEFSWRAGAGLRAYPLIVPAPVPAAAALGIAEWCWRRESDVEKWHVEVDDVTMARSNIAATRAVLPHVHPEGVDWPAVRLALTAPARRLADGRALGTLFGEGWTPILASVHREIDLWQRADETLGPEAVLRLLTLHGSRTESIGVWWGSGWYETVARAAVARAAGEGALPAAVPGVFAGAEELADAAAHHPDLLDDDTFVWLTGAIHQEESRLRDVRVPVPAAATFPGWAAEDLMAILRSDSDEDEGEEGARTWAEARG